MHKLVFVISALLLLPGSAFSTTTSASNVSGSHIEPADSNAPNTKTLQPTPSNSQVASTRPLLQSVSLQSGAAVGFALISFVLLALYQRQTKRLKREKSLSQQYELQSAQLLKMLGSSPIATILLDDQRVIFSNTRARQIFGLDDESSKPLEVTDIFQSPVNQKLVKKVLADKGQLIGTEVNFKKPSGGGFFGLASFYRMEVDDKPYTLCWIFDASSKQQQLAKANQAKEGAEQVNQTQSALLSKLILELQTPINAIAGISKLALQQQLPKTTQHQLSHIQTSSTALLETINDIHHLSRLETGQLRLQTHPFDLQAILRSVLDSTERQAQDQWRLTAHIDTTVPRFVMGDAYFLSYILNSLIDSAVAHTPTGMISLDCTLGRSHLDAVKVKFSVTASGSNMTTEDITRLFDPRHAPDVASAHRSLEMTLCQRLVEHMGSKLSVDQEHPQSCGFNFELTLPIDHSRPNLQQWLDNIGEASRKYQVWVQHDQIKVDNQLRQQCTDLGFNPNFFSRTEEIEPRPSLEQHHPTVVVLCAASIPEQHFSDLVQKAQEKQWRIVIPATKESFAHQYTSPQIKVIANPALPQEMFDAMFSLDAPGSDDIDPSVNPGALHQTKRVLVVSASAIELEYLQSLLGHYKFEVDKANTTTTAIKKAQKQHFDLLLISPHSISAVANITKMFKEVNPNSPVIGLCDDQQSIDHTLKATAFDHTLVKPITSDKVRWIARQYMDHGENADQASTSNPSHQPQQSQQDTHTLATRKPVQKAVQRLHFDALLGLKNYNHDHKLHSRMIEQALTTSPKRFASLRLAIIEKRWHDASCEAHALKRMFAAIGATSLSAICAEYERYYSSSPKVASQALTSLQQPFEQMAVLARHYLANSSKSPSQLDPRLNVALPACDRVTLADALPTIEHLSRLVGAYSGDSVKVAKSLKDRLARTQFEQAVGKIDQQVSTLHYDKAAKQLEALISEIRTILEQPLE